MQQQLQPSKCIIRYCTWSESVACVSVESLTGLNVKQDAGADIDSVLCAGDVDADDVDELCDDDVTADMVNCTNTNSLFYESGAL